MPGRKYAAGLAYRYGFGGQEKSEEIEGEGNSYTASYWEYNPRLGKRWNVDPKTKPNRSPYDAFANNPILKIDPNGDDDFWVIDKNTGKAQLLRQDDAKTHDIRVQVGDKFLKLSELTLDWEDAKMVSGLSDIVATYVSIANLQFNYNCDHETGVFIGGAGIADGRVFDKTNPAILAFFNPEDESMYLNIIDGKISSPSDDAYNLMSSFQHENKHKEDFLKKKNDKAEYTFGDHADVYIFQMSQNIFKKTTHDFKLSMAISAVNHYLNAITGGASGKPDTDEKLKTLKTNLDLALQDNGMYFEITRALDEKNPWEFKIYDSKTHAELTQTNFYEALKASFE